MAAWQRHQLADLHAGQAGRDRLERAAIFGGGVGLQVVHVDVAGAAAEHDVDDRLGPRSGAGLSFATQQVGQAQTAEAERPRP